MEAAASSDSALRLGSHPGSSEERAAGEERARLLRRPGAPAIVAAVLAALGLASYSTVGDRAIAALMAVVLVIVAATDLERRIIPNRIILPATGIVLLARIATRPAHASEFALAAIVAALAFLIPNLISRAAMGMGDVKLAAFLGAGLGWGAFAAIAAAFLAVFPFALLALIRGGLSARKSTLPFGPFLAFGALLVLIGLRLLTVGGG